MTWKVEAFPSGAMIVTSDESMDDPWLYVFGPGGEENRYRCCENLANYLNGGDRPRWLDDVMRMSEDHAESLDYTRITATGPMFDEDPPFLKWAQDESSGARDARARLMDRLFLPGPTP